MTVEPIVPPPNRVFDLLTALASCLCAQIEADGSPATCFCGVIPGEAAVVDYGGDCATACGSAYVRLVSAYPASGVGVLSESVGNCGAEMGISVEIGISRCIEVPEDGEMPTPGQLLAASEQQYVDMVTIQRAVMCCDALSSKDYMLGTYEPMGPMGGMVGGNWTITLVV